MMEWIDVNVSLPKQYEDVLFGYYVSDGFYTHIGHLTEMSDSTLWLDSPCQIYDGVTHWMPLPKPPEKNND